tara:strand:+ start:111 stop:380 length:270 start_codon:yes stop_codon:yes gene_type:complete
MKYRIDTRYVWFNKKTQIVLMYFMESVPFTFDDIPEEYINDTDVKELADMENSYEPEDLYTSSSYLIEEGCHPLINDVELKNPESLPVD